jgi:catechol 2,3-dioxygenase-like lactoylglutathione lyase family enzyme
MWSIHHVNICAPRIVPMRRFLGELIGLPEGSWTYPDAGQTGEIGHADDSIAYYGSANRGIHAVRPIATFPRDNGLLHNPTVGGHVAITVDDLNAVMERLDRAGIPYSDAGVYAMRGVHQIYVYDPSWNVVEFNQVVDGEVGGNVPDRIQPWEADWGWGIHHVNLQAHDVRETAGFFAEIAGMEEGRWTRPEGADEGAFSIDPAELTIFPLGEGNRGLHIIRPDPLFGRRNGFVVNPSIGGHPAIMVPDIAAVMARMDAAGWHYDDAGVYAMPGMHQIYTLDAAMNVIEVNQRV